MTFSTGQKLGLALGLAGLVGGAASALPPASISEVKSALRVDGENYYMLYDDSIVSEKDKDNKKIILSQTGGQWTLNGKAMPAKFQEEAKKVLKFANEKNKNGAKVVKYVLSTRPADAKKGIKADTNFYNIWSNGRISFGTYPISRDGNDYSKLFLDTNENGKQDEGERYMPVQIDKDVERAVWDSLPEIAILSVKVAEAEKDLKNYSDTISNLQFNIGDREHQLDKLKNNKPANVDVTKSKEYLDLVKSLEEMTANKKEFEGKANASEKQIATLTSQYEGKLKLATEALASVKDAYGKLEAELLAEQRANQASGTQPQGKTLDTKVEGTKAQSGSGVKSTFGGNEETRGYTNEASSTAKTRTDKLILASSLAEPGLLDSTYGEDTGTSAQAGSKEKSVAQLTERDMRDENRTARNYAKEHPVAKTEAPANASAIPLMEENGRLDISGQAGIFNDFKDWNGKAGLMYNLRGNFVGFGLSGGVGSRFKQEVINSETRPTSLGKQYATETKITDPLSLSLAGEVRVGPVLFGLGVENQSNITAKTDTLKKDGVDTKPPIYDENHFSDTSLIAYLGLGGEPIKGWAITGIAGYNFNQRQLSFNARIAKQIQLYRMYQEPSASTRVQERHTPLETNHDSNDRGRN
ncbi:MAG: hypothetical protein WC652_07110 [archaeon]|jgi:hypothetical protein